jgi:carbon-monoxide dehydrogenase large subunit
LASDRPEGVGVPVRRREDRRLLDGEGEYLADLRIPGTLDVAFVRSPIAHGRLTRVTIPDEHREAVFQLRDLPPIRPIQAVNNAPGFQASEYPPLAERKVRFVGEPIALCVAPTRAEAEDIAQACEVEFDELPAVASIEKALAQGAARVHEHWNDNVYVETRIQTGDCVFRANVISHFG